MFEGVGKIAHQLGLIHRCGQEIILLHIKKCTVPSPGEAPLACSLPNLCLGRPRLPGKSASARAVD